MKNGPNQDVYFNVDGILYLRTFIRNYPTYQVIPNSDGTPKTIPFDELIYTELPNSNWFYGNK